MGGADKADGYLRKTNIHQVPYICHNEFFSLSGVPTLPILGIRLTFV